MLWKRGLIIVTAAVILTACTQTTTTDLRDFAQAREEGLHGTSISGGACDGAGQFIPGSLSPGPLTSSQAAEEPVQWSATESGAP